MKPFEEWWAEQPDAIKDHKHLCKFVWTAALREVSSRTSCSHPCPSDAIVRKALELFIDNRTEDLTKYTHEVLTDIIDVERANRSIGCRPYYDIHEALSALG